MGSIQTPAIFLALRRGDTKGVQQAMGEPPRLPLDQVDACFEIALQKDDDTLLATLLKAPLPDRLKQLDRDQSLLGKAAGIANITASKIKLLLDAGCQAISDDAQSQTPLRQILRCRRYAAAQPLIDAGTYTPTLHHAEWVSLTGVPKDHPDTAQVKRQIDQFLAMGFEIIGNDREACPMAFAISRNNPDILDHLVRHGGNPYLVDERRLDPEDYPGLAYAKAQWNALQISQSTPQSAGRAPQRRM